MTEGQSRYASSRRVLSSGTPACAGVTGMAVAKGGWVYIMTGRYRGTLYTGVTSHIAARVWAHREGRGSKFCKRYGLTRLVYAGHAPTIEEAIAREKAMKQWDRAWKIALIEQAKPERNDLFDTIN